MKRVVITGATSMVGAALIRECVENHVEVVAVIRKGTSHLERLPESGLLCIWECDLNELDNISEAAGHCDVFYHLAWSAASKEQRADPILQEQNIKATLDAVRLAKRLGCSKFVGAGSQAEYGEVNHIITSDTPTAPSTAYGMAKYAAGRLSEMLCREYGIIHIWGRIFSVYGRYDNPGTMLNYAIRQFIRKEPAHFSAATQMWDYLHETDAGKIFYFLGERVEKDAVYCVASGEARPLKEFIFRLAENFGPEAECVFAACSESGDVYSLQADTQPLWRDTGYQPMMSFQKGIADVIRYQQQKQNKEQAIGQETE